MGRKSQAGQLIRSRIVGHGDVKPEELLANPLNFRCHPGHQMDALRGSMRELGWLKTILINKTTGHVLDGHARVKEAMAQGLKTIPATIVELSPEEERLALAVLDPITELATRDDSILADLLAQVETDDAGLQALLDSMRPGEPEAAESGLREGVDEDAVPDAPKVATTQPGDLYILGRHRLLCGDSTNQLHVGRLMNGGKADMVFTDPPYGIGYQRISKDFKPIANDQEAGSAEQVTRDALALAGQPSAVFVCCDWRSMPTMHLAMEGADLSPKACIVWDKERGVQNLDRFYKRHEFILYAGPYGGQKTVDGDVWACARDFEPDHPTPKPVALIERALSAASSSGQIVLDFFGGSGSTLIACEKLGRSARLMELDPIYCDVIVKRWEEATGRKAERIPVDA